MMESEDQHMANNSVIKLITDNYDMAKEWYHSLMRDGQFPGVGKIYDLPEDNEDRSNMIAILIISKLEAIRTGSTEICLPVGDFENAVFLFADLMDADLIQDPQCECSVKRVGRMNAITPDETRERILDVIDEKRMSIKRLIDATGDNLNLYKYLRGETHTISADRIAKIAIALGVSCDYLLTEQC
jgi:hypothetical protein